jgi:NAD(P)-dependent dehydrogenase (short-subunit alcohol dehydrogenase family)
MSEYLSGKRALVTGGSKGIGFAVAQALLSEGAHVAICARESKPLQAALTTLNETCQPGQKAIGRTADVSRAGDVAQFFDFAVKELAGVDILINNAGLGIFRPTAELTVEEWDRQIGVNLSGAFYCSREALHRFDLTRDNWIVNISSLAGKNPFSGGSGYNASKFGLNGFSEAMMLDHRADNVRVSYIMPGSVDTHFSSTESSKWKIAPEDVAQIVLNVLHMPARTLISRVEVRPSRPQKN